MNLDFGHTYLEDVCATPTVYVNFATALHIQEKAQVRLKNV
jgi:hypothetical protein